MVNATLKGGRRRAALLIAWMRVTCCSREVLRLFMAEVVVNKKISGIATILINPVTNFFFFFCKKNVLRGMGPGDRFSKLLNTFRAPKAICEIANCLFWKADLLTCFQGCVAANMLCKLIVTSPNSCYPIFHFFPIFHVQISCFPIFLSRCAAGHAASHFYSL